MSKRRMKPSEMPGWPRWMPLDLAMAYVGLGETRFHEDITSGKLPRPAQQRPDRWDMLELDRYLEQQSTTTGGAAAFRGRLRNANKDNRHQAL